MKKSSKWVPDGGPKSTKIRTMSGLGEDFCVFLRVLVLDVFFEGQKVGKVRFLGGSNL